LLEGSGWPSIWFQFINVAPDLVVPNSRRRIERRLGVSSLPWEAALHSLVEIKSGLILICFYRHQKYIAANATSTPGLWTVGSPNNDVLAGSEHTRARPRLVYG